MFTVPTEVHHDQVIEVLIGVILKKTGYLKKASFELILSSSDRGYAVDQFLNLQIQAQRVAKAKNEKEEQQ